MASSDHGNDDVDPFVPPPVYRRRRGGRPPSARAFRSDTVRFRVLPSEKAVLVATARRAGYPDLSSWSRGTLLATCAGEGMPVLDQGAGEEVARLRRDLGSGVGANLNQVLAHANALAKGGMPVDAGHLADAVRDARDALHALHENLAAVLRPRGRR